MRDIASAQTLSEMPTVELGDEDRPNLVALGQPVKGMDVDREVPSERVQTEPMGDLVERPTKAGMTSQ